MPSTQSHEAFVTFMVDYTTFLARMCADENDKMAALTSKELPRIEHSITVSQANAKQLQNMEEKRLSLQAAAGYNGLTFRQLIQKSSAEEQEKLWQLFAGFEKNVAEIRFYNNKSMAIARDNMMEIDPESALPGTGAGAKPGNPYEKMRGEKAGQNNLLETKA